MGKFRVREGRRVESEDSVGEGLGRAGAGWGERGYDAFLDV